LAPDLRCGNNQPDLPHHLYDDMTDTEQLSATNPAWLKLVPKIDSPVADAAIQSAETAAGQMQEILRDPKAVGAALAAVADAMDRK
jgi:hypothetical protein